MSIHTAIIRRLIKAPTRVAMTDDLRPYKGYELLIAALHIARLLDKEGASKHVALLLPASGATAFCALGAWWSGRVVVPLNFLLKDEELQYVVDDCETDTIIASRRLTEHTGFVPRAKRVIYLEGLKFSGFPMPRWPRAAADDDLAVLLYTSGTSGRPKGVMLTHRNIMSNVRQCEEGLGLTSSFSFLGVLPQFHSFGFTVLTILPLVSGARVRFCAKFVPTQILKLLEEVRPNTFVAIPSMYNALLHAKNATPEHFASLKNIVSGGEPLPDAVFDGFMQRFNVRICEGYGLTETSPVTHWCTPEAFKRPSVGRPLPGVDQRIVDPETDTPVPVGEEGEIRLKGPNIMKGYFKLPEETAGAFDKEGYFRTGDFGRIDQDGYLSITGRLKDMLIIGGENVFPREIEEVLDAHEAVHASAVIGRADDMRGEVPLAFIELNEGATTDEASIRSWCRERLAGYKVPKEVRIIDALPRNPTGKIMRRTLRERVAEE
ncbi:MAG: long-chain fatty acid--CoA ligase [Phycisphaerales bacterium]